MRTIIAALGALACALTLIGCSASGNPVAGAIGLGGTTAQDVFDDLKAAGIPITEGRPASGDFADIVDNNRCEDSKGIVRTDADVGWALICVGIEDPDLADALLDSMDGSPALLGALYAETEDRDVIVFGFGWYAEASSEVHAAIGGGAGTYLTVD